MEAEIMGVLVFAIGAVMAVMVPYVLKAYKDGVKFDVEYLYGASVSILVAAIVALPAEVDTTFRGLAMIFLAGMGMQGVANKIVSVHRSRK